MLPNIFGLWISVTGTSSLAGQRDYKRAIFSCLKSAIAAMIIIMAMISDGQRMARVIGLESSVFERVATTFNCGDINRVDRP